MGGSRGLWYYPRCKRATQVVVRGCKHFRVWGCVGFFNEAWPDLGVRNTIEEEGSRTTPSSAEADSSGTTHIANPPLRRWRVDVRATVYDVTVDWADQGFENMMEKEGRRTTLSSAARVACTPPLHSGSDGCGQIEEDEGKRRDSIKDKYNLHSPELN
ncbi:hypothetical protein Cgig2_021554 [Carnegiea gigantea]|uniref:Uncharacterized protein n=1 Tax=Carnegiea gigantea TaxID=171969 RepID=A0A9Q1QGB2_9CARY|nr:hypothetical protein Cgig2_021554 [Carnegiea gigantea]